LPKSRADSATPDAEAVALRLLARREHGRAELAAKLDRRGVPAEEIVRTLDRLEARGLLSEQRFVEQLIVSRLRRGYGPLRIRADLAARRIDSRAADDGLALDDAEWAARAERARRRQFGEKLPRERAERARQARFLERRGFTAAQIGRVLRGVSEDFGDN
jgi:regulatory protein